MIPPPSPPRKPQGGGDSIQAPRTHLCVDTQNSAPLLQSNGFHQDRLHDMQEHLDRNGFVYLLG